ncbi:hypothetical protein WN943_022994 [Citrus x changshan-huyou]
MLMLLMSTSMVLCDNLLFIDQNNKCRTRSSLFVHNSSSCLIQFSGKKQRLCGFIPNAKKGSGNKYSKGKRSWWQRFFLDDDGNWFGLKDNDLIEEENDISSDGELSENEKFEAWKRRAEAIVELREAQQDMRNEENRRWEDWIMDDNHGNGADSSWSQDFGNGIWEGNDLSELFPERGLVESVRDLVLGTEENDILYEDRVFRYASTNSSEEKLIGQLDRIFKDDLRATAKFLALLILIPWALDFVVHDFVLMPFLDRYVKTVPLAAQMLDVRRSQKLEMVKVLKTEKARFRLEVEIGKSPPLSDEEVWWELRDKALELRDERRLENRKAFANLWYHSESGWQTLVEIILEHYGIEADESAIITFVCVVPVFMDACVKLWLFKKLPGLAPRVSNIFKEMRRH